MPATTTTAVLSWALYLGACAALVASTSPYLSHLEVLSADAAGSRVLQGVCAVLGGLRPGLEVRFAFGGEAGTGPVYTDGRTLHYGDVPGSPSLVCSRDLPAMVFHPGVVYSARMAGATIEVSEVG